MKKNKFCNSCGNEISDSQEFCNNCGNKLSSSNNEKTNKIFQEKKNTNRYKIHPIFLIMAGILVITTIFLVVIALPFLSSGITTEISSGTQHDELIALKSNYTDLEAKFNMTKPGIVATNNKGKQQRFIDAELELIKANSAIEDVEAGLKIGKPADEIDKRIKIAKKQLVTANQAYNKL